MLAYERKKLREFAVAKLEVELKQIREIVNEVSRNIDSLLEDRETAAMMLMSQPLRDFLAGEPLFNK